MLAAAAVSLTRRGDAVAVVFLEHVAAMFVPSQVPSWPARGLQPARRRGRINCEHGDGRSCPARSCPRRVWRLRQVARGIHRVGAAPPHRRLGAASAAVEARVCTRSALPDNLPSVTARQVTSEDAPLLHDPHLRQRVTVLPQRARWRRAAPTHRRRSGESQGLLRAELVLLTRRSGSAERASRLRAAAVAAARARHPPSTCNGQTPAGASSRHGLAAQQWVARISGVMPATRCSVWHVCACAAAVARVLMCVHVDAVRPGGAGSVGLLDALLL